MNLGLPRWCALALLGCAGVLFAQSSPSEPDRLVLHVNGQVVEPFRVFPESGWRPWLRRLRILGGEATTLPAEHRTVYRVELVDPGGGRRDVTHDPRLELASDGCLRLYYDGTVQPDARPSCGDPNRPRFYIAYPVREGTSRIAASYRFSVVGSPQRLPGLPPARTADVHEREAQCSETNAPCSSAAPSSSPR